MLQASWAHFRDGKRAVESSPRGTTRTPRIVHAALLQNGTRLARATPCLAHGNRITTDGRQQDVGRRKMQGLGAKELIWRCGRARLQRPLRLFHLDPIRVLARLRRHGSPRCTSCWLVTAEGGEGGSEKKADYGDSTVLEQALLMQHGEAEVNVHVPQLRWHRIQWTSCGNHTHTHTWV